MADEREQTERTEDPTQKRRDDALAHGDVAKSQEVNTWFVLGGALLVLFAFGGSATTSLRTTLQGLLGNAHAFTTEPAGLLRLIQQVGIEVLAALAIPFLLLALAAIGGNLVQHRLVWSAEQLQPKLSK